MIRATTIAVVLDRARSRRGAISLVTFIYMAAVGLVTLITLSALGSAAYSHARLTQAAQAAAYAAVGEVEVGASDSQPRIQCTSGGADGPGTVPVCTGGQAFRAAESVLRANLDCRVGLLYPGAVNRGGYCNQNVALIDGGIQVYNLPNSVGYNRLAEANINENSCAEGEAFYNPTRYGQLDPTTGETSPPPPVSEIDPANNFRICWQEPSLHGVPDRAPADGVDRGLALYAPVHYTSGVVVRVRGSLRIGFAGFCRRGTPATGLVRALSCREINIESTGIAAFAQQTEYTDHEDDQDYVPSNPDH